MEEARKIIVELPLTLIVTTIAAMASALVAMAVYFVSIRKSDKRDAKENMAMAKENLTMLTDVLIKNSESHTLLSVSIDRSRESQERIQQETNRILSSLTEKIIRIENGRH